MLGDTTLLGTQLTAAGVAVWAIQKIKALPTVQMLGKRAIRVLALGVAAIGAVGISYTWNGAAHELVIHNLTAAAVGGMLLAWFKAAVVQELTYRATLKSGDSMAQRILDAVAEIKGQAPGGNVAAGLGKQPNSGSKP